MSVENMPNIVINLASSMGVSKDGLDDRIKDLESAVGCVQLGGVLHDDYSFLIEALSRECGENGSNFADKCYEAVGLNTIAQLIPMLEILKGICMDSSLKESISIPISSTTDSAAYQIVKYKLFQKIHSKPVSPLTSGRLDESPCTSRVYPERPFLSGDFLLGRNDNNLFEGPIGLLPLSSQESTIIQDLLFVLVGVTGTYIHSVSNAKLSFDIDPSMDTRLREMVALVLPLANHYSTVIKFVEKQSQKGTSRVNQALSGAIYGLIKDYYILIAQLETLRRQDNLTLHKLWFYIQPTVATLKSLADICDKIESSKCRGGMTLSLLHEEIVLKSGDQRSLDVYMFLMDESSKPFFDVLHLWILRGIIIDPGADFFVEDHELVDRNAMPMEYSDEYWERRYSLRVDRLPNFLKSFADIIAKTGKYLNVIQQCDKSRNDANIELGVLKKLKYTSCPDEYSVPLEMAFTIASKNLLHLLVKDHNLMGHLRSVKHYFLLDQGDFIVQFMDLCEKELYQNVDNVEPNRLDSLLELALRTSGAKADPNKDNVYVDLLPYTLLYQMSKILSIDTETEDEFKGIGNSSDLTGLKAFSFGYHVEWPVSLVLNRKAQACYQMLFRHLFYCKHVERRICKVWLVTKVTKYLKTDQFSVYYTSFVLRQKMLNFVQDLQYYMTFEVFEPNWQGMIEKMKNVTNIDQVLQIHSDFTSTCLNDCMLSNADLLLSVTNLLGVCINFSIFMKRFSSGKGDQDPENFLNEITKFDLEFSAKLLSLLDRIATFGQENYGERILNILYRLDFNGFYTNLRRCLNMDTITVAT